MIAHTLSSRLSRTIAALLVLFSLRLYGEEWSDGKPRRLILSIGIAEFEDPFWKALQYTTHDARNIHSFLMHQAAPSYDWGRLVVSGAEHGRSRMVTREALLKAMKDLQMNNRSENDIVIVFLSTHGTIDYNRRGKLSPYIVTSDTNSKNIMGTGLLFNDFLEEFSKLKSKKRALILDYCHSGTGKSVLTPEIFAELQRHKGNYFPEISDDSISGEYILAASGLQEKALEADEFKSGVYTHFLLEGFGKDLNGDGAVSLTEAHNFARLKTHEYTKGQQTPTQKVSIEGTDPILITGKAGQKRLAYLFSFWKEISNYDIYVNDAPRGRLKGGVAVPGGKVRLKLVDPETNEVKLDRVVSFEEGREYPILDILSPVAKNSIDFGYGIETFLGRGQQEDRSPGQFRTLNITYTQKDFWRVYNGTLAYSYETAQNRFSIGSNDSFGAQTIHQKIVGHEALLALGMSDNVKLFPFSAAVLKNELYWHAGVLLRKISSYQTEVDRGDDALTSGLKATLGLRSILPIYNMRSGVEIWDVLERDPFQNKVAVSSRLGACISFGYQW
jgi:hypothetical protein